MSKKKRTGLSAAGISVLTVIVLGSASGFVLSTERFLPSTDTAISAFILGLIMAAFLVQWLAIAFQLIALLRDPIPLKLDVANVDVVSEHLEKISSQIPLAHRASNLLETWVNGRSARQVLELARFQSDQARNPVAAEPLFLIFLIAAYFSNGGSQTITWVAFIMLGITLYARQNLLSTLDSYVESHLLVRLPTNIPQTAMTARELADALTEPIRGAFKEYIPQPEKMSAAIDQSVKDIGANIAKEIEDLHKKLIQNQASLVETWTDAAKKTTHDLREIEKALGAVVQDLTGGLASGIDNLKKNLAGHTTDLDKCFSGLSSQIKEALHGGSQKLEEAIKTQATEMEKVFSVVTSQLRESQTVGADKLEGSLKEHASQFQAISQTLVGQLDRIADLERGIEKVLHVQQVIDGTIQTVASAEEFQKTLSALRDHLAESDKVMREASRPRTIQLVETDREEG